MRDFTVDRVKEDQAEESKIMRGTSIRKSPLEALGTGGLEKLKEEVSKAADDITTEKVFDPYLRAVWNSKFSEYRDSLSACSGYVFQRQLGNACKLRGLYEEGKHVIDSANKVEDA